MKLQTQIPIAKQSENPIDYYSNILLLGSCFVENIGAKLDYYKFQTLQNPFGVLFQPKAIESLVVNAVKNKNYDEADVFYHNERWHCFEGHSKLSRINKEDLISELNSQLAATQRQIKKASHIIITLGTAWVYRFLESNTLVANCHKVPQKQFKKELLSVEAIYGALENMVAAIRSENSEVVIIFTVSPVRHIKDGFVENTLSKSHLVTAIHQFLKRNTNSKTQETYFPSYEIMMDELRDYRFYTEDMVHPNSLAIHYIWERFINTWCSSETLKTIKVIEDIQKGLQHKPFNPQSEAHQLFLKKLQLKIEQLQTKYSHITF